MTGSTDDFALAYQATLDGLADTVLRWRPSPQAHLQACKDLGREAEYQEIAARSSSWSRALVERDAASVKRLFDECHAALRDPQDIEANNTYSTLQQGASLLALYEAAPDQRGQIAEALLSLSQAQPGSHYQGSFWTAETLAILIRERPDQGVALLDECASTSNYGALVEALYDVGRLDAERLDWILKRSHLSSSFLQDRVRDALDHPSTRLLLETALAHIQGDIESSFTRFTVGHSGPPHYPATRAEWRWDHLMLKISAPAALYHTPPAPGPAPTPRDTPSAHIEAAISEADQAHEAGEDPGPALAEIDRLIAEGQRGDVEYFWHRALLSNALLRLKLKGQPDKALMKALISVIKLAHTTSRGDDIRAVYTQAAQTPRCFTAADLKSIGRSLPKAARLKLWRSSSERQENIFEAAYAVGGAPGVLEISTALLDKVPLVMSGFLMTRLAAEAR